MATEQGMRVTKKKIALVERLIREELDRQINRHDIVEIVDDSFEFLISEAEGDIDPTTVGGMAQLAQAASDGNEEAQAGLQQSAGKVNIAGDIQKLQGALEEYGAAASELEQKFGAALSEAGWGGLPAAQEMHNAMNQTSEQMRKVMQQGFDGIKETAATLQDVQKDIKEKGGKKDDSKLNLGDVTSSTTSAEEADKGEKGETTGKTMGKGLASAAKAVGLFTETKNHRRLK